MSRILLRDPDGFPTELKFLLDIITINEIPKVVGSYAYANHRYPSDVDVFDQVTLRLNKKQAAEEYTRLFKNIFQKLLILSNDVYINDFKTGEHDGKPIRWTVTQILNGYQILGNLKVMKLETALSMEAVTKLDIIAYIGGKYQSIEVFYNLRYTENEEQLDFYPLGSYAKSLLEDVEKYSSKEFYAPLKVAKRLWSLSRVTACEELFEAIDPLMRSEAAALNQVKSDLEILRDLLYDTEYTLQNSKPLASQVELNRIVKYNETINRIHLQIL
ncbi:MAG TPA: hypothetical protein VKR58_03025, partial [Aquella sp.]|nr:hypothetical protein [Aquella sp.]